MYGLPAFSGAPDSVNVGAYTLGPTSTVILSPFGSLATTDFAAPFAEGAPRVAFTIFPALLQLGKSWRKQLQLLLLTISGRLHRPHHLRQSTVLNLTLLHVVGYVSLVLVHVLRVVRSGLAYNVRSRSEERIKPLGGITL